MIAGAKRRYEIVRLRNQFCKSTYTRGRKYVHSQNTRDIS